MTELASDSSAGPRAIAERCAPHRERTAAATA